jgi:hypothetical protein
MHLNESCYELLSFASIYDTFCMYERKRQKIPENDDSFCCFMESGYLEDGIYILLKAFSLYKAASSAARLTIKMPDAEELQVPLPEKAEETTCLFNPEYLFRKNV